MSDAKEAPVFVAMSDGTVEEAPGLHVTVSGIVTGVDRQMRRVTVELPEDGDTDEFDVGADVALTVCFVLTGEDVN